MESADYKVKNACFLQYVISMSPLINVFLTFILCALILPADASEYWKTREKLLLKEKSSAMGGNLVLTANEIEANKIFLRLKKQELQEGHQNDSYFLSGRHFFKSKEEIINSEVYKIIRKMPKGACLHIHLTASAPLEFVLNITNRKNLYGCDRGGRFQLRFFKDDSRANFFNCKPLDVLNHTASFDKFLLRQVSVLVDNPEIEYERIEKVWARFKSAFSTLYYMISYRPVLEDYIYEALNQLYLDNVFYVEFRGTNLPMYELNETIYSPVEFIKVVHATVEKFKQDHPGFLGARFILASYRGVDNTTFESYVSVFQTIKAAFPDFVAGFDLIGYEDKTTPLQDFVNELQRAHLDVRLFLHSGETKWYGSTDLNLVDAVLLNASRIGHGLALQKHPEILKLIKERNIAIEVMPISNQVLKFVDDLRNHPAVGLISRGYPVVVANDDPGLWNASGLSFDLYVTVMAMTSQDAGLEVLKQFALNSIRYSAMRSSEKVEAFKLFDAKWMEYIQEMLQNYGQDNMCN